MKKPILFILGVLSMAVCFLVVMLIFNFFDPSDDFSTPKVGFQGIVFGVVYITMTWLIRRNKNQDN